MIIITPLKFIIFLSTTTTACKSVQTQLLYKELYKVAEILKNLIKQSDKERISQKYP